MYIPYMIWRIHTYQNSFDTTRSHVPWLAGCPIDIHSTAYPKYVHTLRDMTHSHVSWLLYICAMTHLYVPKLKNRTNRRTITNIGICGMLHKTCTRTLNAWCDVFTCVPWPCLVPERDMTHVCVCRDSCRKGGKQVIHVCAMTWWLFCLWLICVCVMTRIIRVTHRSFMCVSWLHDSSVCVPMTDSNESWRVANKSCMPHEKLLGIQRVSTPSTKSLQISTPAHSSEYEWEMHVSPELMV